MYKTKKFGVVSCPMENAILSHLDKYFFREKQKNEKKKNKNDETDKKKIKG